MIQKKIALLSIVFLINLILFGCSTFMNNKKVFTGESKHWKVQFEVTKKPDDNSTNGSFQLEFLGGQFFKGEYQLIINNEVRKSGTANLDTRHRKEKYPFGYKSRSNYDYDHVQNSTITYIIKWDGFEEKIKLTPQ
ncbi:hypothetical protein [Thermoflavimicrobium daqui]|uniref:Lipoprotein n=1 Tax=Thermoflavimicrobium daqui TaxID=2137476 RepID=A0A364K149_9BACL|nr:hypothetical protein [Thermoflavimicrobium daqui]RAL21303.1 hypothetical protein DL897_16825 [Thermoflavimicrobium daqui]